MWEASRRTRMQRSVTTHAVSSRMRRSSQFCLLALAASHATADLSSGHNVAVRTRMER